MNIKNCAVLIPYYNAGYELVKTLIHLEKDTSIIIDVFIVDDGSEVISCVNAIKEYKGKLKINILNLQSNMGIEYALNFGLKKIISQYEFIARLDCGDICVNNRIKKQISYLTNNPECYLVGSWVDFFNNKDIKIFTLKHPIDNNSIKERMKINSALTHPSVMFRSEVFKLIGLYPTSYPAAEDYALFYKIIQNKLNVANIPEVLVKCTVDEKGISSVKRKIQIKSRIKIMKKHSDNSPLAIYGIIRSILLYYTPRKLSLFINKTLEILDAKSKN